jgi:hypothetical protein
LGSFRDPVPRIQRSREIVLPGRRFQQPLSAYDVHKGLWMIMFAKCEFVKRRFADCGESVQVRDRSNFLVVWAGRVIRLPNRPRAAAVLPFEYGVPAPGRWIGPQAECPRWGGNQNGTRVTVSC